MFPVEIEHLGAGNTFMIYAIIMVFCLISVSLLYPETKGRNMEELAKRTHQKQLSTMNMITNPILTGFNPDPSICRVGDDFYIATSTFDWFPGVQIHHSRDLVHWHLLTRPLTRVSQLNMKGNPDSCGVWAPNLTYKDGMFYLVYTDVKRFDGRWKDTHNYLVTATEIDGEWSDPIYLNSSGFDPSLFHDEDGRAWVPNLLVDHRKGKFFGGIVLQEYSYRERRLIGEVYYIFPRHWIWELRKVPYSSNATVGII